jgi:hypothetical protein
MTEILFSLLSHSSLFSMILEIFYEGKDIKKNSSKITQNGVFIQNIRNYVF